jgi:integrase/recombinase XerD
MTFVPCLEQRVDGAELVAITLGHPVVDDYLEFVGARGARNTWLAVAYDLKVFFEVVGKQPAEVRTADVFAFLAAQRAPRRGEGVVRIVDGEAGLAARTIARRLSSVAGLFSYLLARGDAGVVSNPVPRGLASRRPGRGGRGGVRLVRTPKTLPRVLSPAEAGALLDALRTRRDRAMVLAMLLGGLRRCEVLGLRLSDVSVGERRVHITCGKGGRERIVPVSSRFFVALGEYLELERPAEATTKACFVVLKDSAGNARNGGDVLPRVQPRVRDHGSHDGNPVPPPRAPADGNQRTGTGGQSGRPRDSRVASRAVDTSRLYLTLTSRSIPTWVCSRPSWVSMKHAST